MDRRRFFGWAAGMLGAGLFWGTRKEPEKPGFVPYPWCGVGRGQNHRPHPSDKDGWAYCTVSCWACDHNLDMHDGHPRVPEKPGFVQGCDRFTRERNCLASGYCTFCTAGMVQCTECGAWSTDYSHHDWCSQGKGVFASGLYRCEGCGMVNDALSTTSVHAEGCNYWKYDTWNPPKPA